jgi:hypothetical protein
MFRRLRDDPEEIISVALLRHDAVAAVAGS